MSQVAIVIMVQSRLRAEVGPVLQTHPQVSKGNIKCSVCKAERGRLEVTEADGGGGPPLNRIIMDGQGGPLS